MKEEMRSLVQTGMTMVMLQAMVHPMVPRRSRITWFARYQHIALNDMCELFTFTTKSITFLEAL